MGVADKVISKDLKFPHDTLYFHFSEEAEIYAPFDNNCGFIGGIALD